VYVFLQKSDKKVSKHSLQRAPIDPPGILSQEGVKKGIIFHHPTEIRGHLHCQQKHQTDPPSSREGIPAGHRSHRPGSPGRNRAGSERRTVFFQENHVSDFLSKYTCSFKPGEFHLTLTFSFSWLSGTAAALRLRGSPGTGGKKTGELRGPCHKTSGQPTWSCSTGSMWYYLQIG